MPQSPPHIQTSTRNEEDALGILAVPQDVLYGGQTARALDNFNISGIPIGHFPELVRALGMVKLACARANHATGFLSEKKLTAIEAACVDLMAGKLDAEFVVDVFQGGAGTSTNMNANEVIANRGLEIMGYARGEYGKLHPNDDVNRSQSTNDVYPTAVRLSALISRAALQDSLRGLIAALEERSGAFSHVVKVGRTQLQDAVPMTLGQEFGAFAATLREDMSRLDESAALFREINLGGTAVGTRINASQEYIQHAVKELAQISGEPFVSSVNLFEASWDTGGFVTFSGTLRRIAVKLSKICNDLRLLASGPRSGIGEIALPAVQPGSSIMPGKVNPVIPEAVNQVCFQVIGNDLVVTFAAEHGQLQLNAFEPVIIYNILTSMRLLTQAMKILAQKCVSGIAADEGRCEAGAHATIALATALVPVVGYAESSRIAKEALASGSSVAEVAIRHGLDPATIADTLNPLRMALQDAQPIVPLGEISA